MPIRCVSLYVSIVMGLWSECRRNRSFCMYFHCRLRCLFLDILKKGIWPFGCKGAFREKVTQCKGVRLTAR
ncbi:hypothetical protein PG2022B_0354 [Bifidobacterium animalis subsp. animalis]|nr:hypothetical protein PG2022B_0354 [Bifidobacterium animalis subsp. animalis]